MEDNALHRNLERSPTQLLKFRQSLVNPTSQFRPLGKLVLRACVQHGGLIRERLLLQLTLLAVRLREENTSIESEGLSGCSNQSGKLRYPKKTTHQVGKDSLANDRDEFRDEDENKQSLDETHDDDDRMAARRECSGCGERGGRLEGAM